MTDPEPVRLSDDSPRSLLVILDEIETLLVELRTTYAALAADQRQDPDSG